jgi:hypothetical protein
MPLYTTGQLYRLNTNAILFAEASVFSKAIDRFSEGDIVLVVSTTNAVQKIASRTQRGEDAKYGFVKLLIGESVGWCPFAIHFPDGDNASYGRMREHSLLVPLEDDYPKNESSCQ